MCALLAMTKWLIDLPVYLIHKQVFPYFCFEWIEHEQWFTFLFILFRNRFLLPFAFNLLNMNNDLPSCFLIQKQVLTFPLNLWNVNNRFTFLFTLFKNRICVYKKLYLIFELSRGFIVWFCNCIFLYVHTHKQKNKKTQPNQCLSIKSEE